MSDAWSIADGYWDTGGTWHPTSPTTRAALRLAMGGAELDEPPAPPPMLFVADGDARALAGRFDLVLEDDTVLPGLRALPPDLPLGYHDLQPVDGGDAVRLVVTPRRCPLPQRMWGWAAQLYATRSESSWGMGDLADLRELGRWSASLGAGVVMINPLHATAPVQPQQPSPYAASTRLWRNPLYLRPTDLPFAADLGDRLTALDAAGRALNADRVIDRDRILALKLTALELLFDRYETGDTGKDAFTAWLARQGPELVRFATYCTIAERHGPAYTQWPETLRHPASAAVAQVQHTEARRVRFHEWCQWHLFNQLGTAADAGTPLMADIAVGFDPSGADAWGWQDLLGIGCRVGAPPDSFNPAGQDWGLPPFVPWKLREAGYEPFIQTVRASFAHMGGIRIDHVMGLFRLYWVPPEGGPRDGAYVRYPHRDLLDLLSLEAHRAGAFVVGEDLGTVEDEVRADLEDYGVLSYRLLWFEDTAPADFPRQALAGVTTHDLPTIAGVWDGTDLAHRQRLGHAGDGSDDAYFRDRLHDVTGLDISASTEEMVVAVHEALAEVPSLVVLATLDDAIGVPERPNLPGTIDEWPNWRIPLPVSLEAIETHPLALRVAEILDEGVRRREGP